MTDRQEAPPSLLERLESVERENAKLHKINKALMDRVERSMDAQGNAFSLFQTSVVLGQVVRDRTADLSELNTRLHTEIAERLEAEAGLKWANSELQAANRELDSFAYAVSHDLRAPLRAMNGFSQALIEDAGHKLSQEELVYLQHILKSSVEMANLIDGLLTLSRHMRSEMYTDTVDVSVLAEGIRGDLIRTETGRQVNWRIEPNLTAVGDRNLIGVLLSNLLTNAWKYTAKTSSAEISLTVRDIDGRRWFCVADNGAGFDMAHADRLFLPFQRLHHQNDFPGLGIGLATVSRIISRHGGLIQAEGAVGRGACFSFHLPMPSIDHITE